MDEISTTMTLTKRLREPSISSHHSTTDNNSRTSLIKTKIQKIDGQYKASPTCPTSNEDYSSDDQDEPLIVATLPPLVQDSSNYRIRKDIYDDETGDDQQSNSSSLDSSPIHSSESLVPIPPSFKPAIVTIEKPKQLLNDHENRTTNETSVDIPPMLRKTTSSNPFIEENIQAKSALINESAQQRTNVIKRKSSTKVSISNSSSAISVGQNQANHSTDSFSSSLPSSTIDPVTSTTENTIHKSTTSINFNISNNEEILNTDNQSKVKVPLKTPMPSSRTTKPKKSIGNTIIAKSVDQKSAKKCIPAQKETVNIIRKSTATAASKKPIKTSANKPLRANNNSEKQPLRPLTTTSSSKLTEKKSSDTSNSTMATNNRSIESLSVKPSPVALGKIPKLNLANRPKSMEKPTSSKSLTDQKFDTLVSNFTVTSNKNSKMSEKSLTNRLKSPPKHRSPQRSQRLQQNPIETSGSFAPTSPIVPDDSINNSLQKQPSVSYHTHASLPDTNTRLSSNFSHQDSITLENTQSQSPLSPDPSSTLYPPPSPPSVPPFRPIPPSAKTFIDSRTNQSHVLTSASETTQSFKEKHFSMSNIDTFSGTNSSSNLINTQSITSITSISNDYPNSSTTNKSNNLWDSESSEEDPDDDSNARRFFQQNMRAADEELSKMDKLPMATTFPPADSRTEQLLKRQKKASLCFASNDKIYENDTVELSTSVDDFECVAMDLDSPKHRTQSESSDNNHATIESKNDKSTNNGSVDSKTSEVAARSLIETSSKSTSKTRPLKTTSMTLIDELKNSINPSSTYKQSVLSPPSRSLFRSRTSSRSRSRSRTHSRSHSRSSLSSRSSSSSASSSFTSRKRHSRSRRRSSRRRSNKHYQRRRSDSYDDDNQFNENGNSYPATSIHYQSYHHYPHSHHQSHWLQTRQSGGLLPGPPPPAPPPSRLYGHQPNVPPLLSHHPYYPPSNRSMMHPVEPTSVPSPFSFPHNPHQRHRSPLMHPSYYTQGPPPQPLMQSVSRSHHQQSSINRYPPPVRLPFDLPSYPMSIGNVGAHLPNSNYNQYRYESEERLSMRRTNRGTSVATTNTNNNRRGVLQQAGSNGKNKTNNPPKSNMKSSDRQDMDQLFLKRDRLLAQLNEISESTDIGNNLSLTSSSHNKQPISKTHSDPTKSVDSQDDEGEEGEISESD